MVYYSGMFIQAYSGIFRALCKPGIFKAAAYVGPWRIQGLRVQGLRYWGPSASACSGPWHIHGPGVFRAPVCLGRWRIRVRGIFGAVSGICDGAFCGGSWVLWLFSRVIIFLAVWGCRVLWFIGWGSWGGRPGDGYSVWWVMVRWGAGPVGFLCSRWYTWVGCAICGWGRPSWGSWGGLLKLGFNWGPSGYATTMFWFIVLSFYLWR